VNLTEAVRENLARVQQINDAIDSLRQRIADLQAERTELQADVADLRAYLQSRGVTSP
jgi:prefoldin subunit 5